MQIVAKSLTTIAMRAERRFVAAVSTRFCKKLFNLQKSMQKLPKKEEALLQIPGVPGTEVSRSEGAPALAAAAAGGERGGGIRGGGGKEEAEGKKKA